MVPAGGYTRGVCAQCMTGAATVAAAASGLRAWVGAVQFRWMTPLRLKRLTAALFAVSFAITAIGIG